MRPRISKRGFVRPLVRRSVRRSVMRFFFISQKWLKMIRINQKSHQNNFQTLLQSFFPNLSFTITFFNLYKIWDASLYPRVLVAEGLRLNNPVKNFHNSNNKNGRLGKSGGFHWLQRTRVNLLNIVCVVLLDVLLSIISGFFHLLPICHGLPLVKAWL